MALLPMRGGGHRILRVIALTSLMAVVATACSDDSEPTDTTPITAERPAIDPRTDPVPSIDIPASALLPREVAGVDLEIVVVDTGPFADDEGLAAAFERVGATVGDVSLAFAAAPVGSPLSFFMGAWRVAQVDWATALEEFVLHLQGAVDEPPDVAVVVLADVEVLRATPSDPSFLPMYYFALGDILVYAQTDDEAALAEVLAQMITEGYGGYDMLEIREQPPPRRATPLSPAELGPVSVPDISGAIIGPAFRYACVNWTEDFYFVFFMTDPALRLGPPFPWPVTVSVAKEPILGTATVGLTGQSTAVVRYEAARYDLGLRFDDFHILVHDVGATFSSQPFEVKPCLSGLWQDGDRVLRLVHENVDVTADLVEGSLRCAGEGQTILTAHFREPLPDGRWSIEGVLVVCNPQRCVDEGKLDAGDIAVFEGIVHGDARTITIEWEGKFFDHDCEFVRMESHSFDIHLNSAAPPRPH